MFSTVRIILKGYRVFFIKINPKRIRRMQPIDCRMLLSDPEYLTKDNKKHLKNDHVTYMDGFKKITYSLPL